MRREGFPFLFLASRERKDGAVSRVPSRAVSRVPNEPLPQAYLHTFLKWVWGRPSATTENIPSLIRLGSSLVGRREKSKRIQTPAPLAYHSRVIFSFGQSPEAL